MKRLKIIIHEEQNIKEIEIIINCVSADEEVEQIISTLNGFNMKFHCRCQGEMFQLDVGNIIYIESVERKTFLYTENQIYETDKRLYELETYLRGQSFFRASKAFIINLKRVKSLRPEVGARLLLTMDNDEKIIVSRQYAGNIKNVLEV